MSLTLKDFEGCWQIERQIQDRLTGRIGRLQGRAEFYPDEMGLTYDETGLLEFPGHPKLNASQRYLWRANGDRISVHFADGRNFHLIDITNAQPQAVHDCPPDWYNVRYDFAAWPNWNATWDVTGPRKDYRSVTKFHPG